MKHETNHTHQHPEKAKDQLTGPQGVDKAPGEDQADNPKEGVSIAQSQKAKKVDGNPGEETGQQ